MRWLAASAAAAVASVSASAILASPLAAEDLKPRNQCRNIPGYAEFERKFVTAVANRNVDMMASLADPQIKLDFGGGSGRAEFRRRLAEPDSHLWDELAALLPLGCGSRNGISIALPWYWTQDFGTDPFTSLIILGDDIPLYSRPDKTGAIIASLDWQNVELIGEGGSGADMNYAHIRPATGPAGYVEWKYLRWLIDYRLLATPGEDGALGISAFIAGD